MNSLLITMTFLMLMVILTTTSVKNYMDSTHETTIYDEYLLSEKERTYARAAQKIQIIRDEVPDDKKKEELKEEKPKKADKPATKRKKSIDLNFDRNRPPNNSRLNFFLLLHANDDKEAPLKRDEIAAALMRRLYGEMDFFKEIPGLENKILEAMHSQMKNTETFTAPDQLTSLEFEDKKVQEAFYQMVSKDPSLLYYITFDKETHHPKNKINLMFVPPELLEAIFAREPHIIGQLLAARQTLWERILYEEEHREEPNSDFCLTRGKIAELIAGEYKKIVSDESYTKLFDFTLGHPGTVLFIPTSPDKTLRKRLF